ncbi:MAG: hypothetical protein ACR2JV_05615 [Gaiellales bacterium]
MQHDVVEQELRAAATAVRVARAELVRAIASARDAGLSYRKIAAITGMSHEGVRRLANALADGS